MALMPSLPVTYNTGNWARIVCPKPNLMLAYRSQGKNKEHDKIGCVKIEQVINMSMEGKKAFRSMEDKETIKITREILDVLKLF